MEVSVSDIWQYWGPDVQGIPCSGHKSHRLYEQNGTLDLFSLLLRFLSPFRTDCPSQYVVRLAIGLAYSLGLAALRPLLHALLHALSYGKPIAMDYSPGQDDDWVADVLSWMRPPAPERALTANMQTGERDGLG